MSREALGTTIAKIKNFQYSNSHRYEETPDEEISHFLPGEAKLSADDTSDNRKRLRNTKVTILAALSAILAATLLLLVASRLRHSHTSISYVPEDTHLSEPTAWELVQAGDHIIVDCGSTPEEAQSLGCIWDLMSFSWVHPACYNKNVSDDFIENYGPWKWYKHGEDGKANLNEEIAEHELPYTYPIVWTEEHYHIAHCAFLFKLIHMAGMNGHLVTDEGIPMAHTQHCIKVFLDPQRPDYKDIDTRVHLLYGKCVTIRD